jgi:hypothetical protein
VLLIVTTCAALVVLRSWSTKLSVLLSKTIAGAVPTPASGTLAETEIDEVL